MIAAIGPELGYLAADLNSHTQPGRPAWLFFGACLIVSGPPLPGIRFLMRCVRARLPTRRLTGGLGQDALFVGDLLTFQAAPRPAQAVLAGGCVALVAELDWFEVQAARRGIDLGQPALPATLAYGELLLRLDAAPYEAAVTALWVLERVYLLAWASAASMSTSPFGEFVEHWTAPGFAGYVDALGELAILDGHDELVGDVLSHEVAFWDMAVV
ncbi:MAG: formylaminopyrimidine deformylase / aminopyrimidine aminohydrolase [Mycobacterium sp.]|nr:formylaminopyrimidine deformylase / aminopyrimidine aminohydrolase [Mycobacterium sp.]